MKHGDRARIHRHQLPQDDGVSERRPLQSVRQTYLRQTNARREQNHHGRRAQRVPFLHIIQLPHRLPSHARQQVNERQRNRAPRQRKLRRAKVIHRLRAHAHRPHEARLRARQQQRALRRAFHVVPHLSPHLIQLLGKRLAQRLQKRRELRLIPPSLPPRARRRRARVRDAVVRVLRLARAVPSASRARAATRRRER